MASDWLIENWTIGCRLLSFPASVISVPWSVVMNGR